MLFNSIAFAIFLPVVFLIYWFAANKNIKIQNHLLLLSSYFFYACWDWRFLFLLMFSTVLDYYTGLKMSESRNQHSRRLWFWLSISVNLGFLGAFKYYNFFISSFADVLSNLGLHVNPWSLSVVLPIGISFYTFHGLSYVIDIYFDRIQAEKNFVDYAVFVCFFPLLVAGPIERATHLLPQIKKERIFNNEKAVDGLRQILWGLFKKIVIADQCADYVNTIFKEPNLYPGSTLAAAAVFFAFQIYCDFSGYSDIALGTARLFGIELLRNFAYPYFSRDIAEFWRRWHISLSSWFRDYVYIPLGGSRGTLSEKTRNVFVIFVLSGLWHGANWTFVLWGLLHAIYFLPLLIFQRNRHHLGIAAQGAFLPRFQDVLKIGITFILVTTGWIFFRAENMEKALIYLQGLFSSSLVTIPSTLPKQTLLSISFLVMVEWIQRDRQYALQFDSIQISRPLRWSLYVILIEAILWYSGKPKEFIYFQF